MSGSWQGKYRLPELLLKRAMLHSKPEIGDELANLLHLWNLWMGDRGGSCGSDNWHVRFFNWALKGRAAEFKGWALERDTVQARGALKAIQKVSGFNWPSNHTQHIFRMLWGWLHEELEIPGTPKRLTIKDQKEALENGAKRMGKRIKKWDLLGPCCFAEFEDKRDEGKKNKEKNT
jgi:hypothetical protein